MKAFTVLKSFRTKITLVLIFSMLFAGVLANYLIYEYSRKEQFEQLRGRLQIIAQAIALNVDAEKLARIPLDPSGKTTPEYKDISEELKKMKGVAPALGYIYPREDRR